MLHCTLMIQSCTKYSTYPYSLFACTMQFHHYSDAIMGAMAYQITSLTIVTQSFIRAQIIENIKARKHQSTASLAFVRGIYRWPVNSTHKWPVTRKMFPLDDVIMIITRWMFSKILTIDIPWSWGILIVLVKFGRWFVDDVHPIEKEREITQNISRPCRLRLIYTILKEYNFICQRETGIWALRWNHS